MQPLWNGTHPIIVGLNKQPYTAIKKIHLDQKIGKENMCKNITEGITLSKKILLKELYGEDEELFNIL